MENSISNKKHRLLKVLYIIVKYIIIGLFLLFFALLPYSYMEQSKINDIGFGYLNIESMWSASAIFIGVWILQKVGIIGTSKASIDKRKLVLWVGAYLLVSAVIIISLALISK